MSRLVFAALVPMMVLGLQLRTRQLDARAFDNDEAFAWRVAIKPLPDLLISAAGDSAPPAHYLFLKGWMTVWGTSPSAMRALSVVCGLLLIVVTYALVVETARWADASVGAARFGGLVAALLAAIHNFQLEPNRTARMYGMGSLLAVLSAWLLLRALRADNRPYISWSAYGVAEALFLLTHHFALFTLSAQGSFAIWCAFWPGAGAVDDQPTARRGILLAAIIAMTLYSPWLAAGIAQTTRVSEDFWVAEHSALEWGQAFVRWCVGIDWADTTLIAICVAGTAIVAVRTLGVRQCSHHAPRDEASSRPGAPGRGLCGCNPAAIALVAQAALPWIAIALMSTFGDRPMLQDRYLAFSHASWLALLGVVVASVARPEWRVGVAAVLTGATLLGTQQFITALPGGPPGIDAASERLATDYQRDAVVVVQEAPDVNCLKFYLSQVSEIQFDIRAWRRPWPQTGHINHVASLESREFLSRIEDLAPNVPQLWFAGTREELHGGSNLPGWEWKDEVTYKGHGPQAPDYVLRCYERAAEGVPTEAK